MRFSETLAMVASADTTAVIAADWLQGRTVFGGLQAALALRALEHAVGEPLPLRALQATFVGPVPAGTVTVSSRVLRRGRSVVQGEARLLSADGDTLCLVIAVFGQARASTLQRQPPHPPATPVDQLPDVPYLEGLTPVFTRQFAMRFARNGIPFSGVTEPVSQTWLAHRDPAPLSTAHLVALADVIPSPALALLKQPAAASSLTWSLDLLQPRVDFDPAAFWRMDAEATAAGDGYVSQTATLFNPAGEAAAYSRQVVTVFG
jgi:acyl-CoA thioesterase